MDLLQEISNRFRSKTGRFWDKLVDVAYDATIGLAKLYQQKTIELVKISAASLYLQGLRVMRKHALLLLSAVFATVLLAVTVVAVPIALVAISPLGTGSKLVLIALFGLLDLGIVALCLRQVVSEEQWMKASGFRELLDSLGPGK